MIQINLPMPEKCTACPCYDNVMYGRCNAAQRWFDGQDIAWARDDRPDWCPLEEVEKE